MTIESATPFDRPDFRRIELSEQVVIDITGADAVDFLQGQLSNDVAAVSAGRACVAGYCNPKGRLLAIPLVIPRAGGDLRLVVPSDIVEGLLKRLRMFVMRADVVFTERDDLGCVGIEAVPDTRESGSDDAPATLSAETLGGPEFPPESALPEALLDVVSGDEAMLIRWHDAVSSGSRKRYLLIGASETLASTEDTAMPASHWRLGDISAGIPRIVAATREAFVPQMVNLQHVDGLSFRKGCYPGQEIVARMQYLGKLKRHMRRFRVDTTVPGNPGDSLALASSPDADGGVIVDAASDDGRTHLLAVVRVGTDLDDLRLHGKPLVALDLPYPLPELDTDSAGETA